MDNTYRLRLADIEFNYRFRFRNTYRFFLPFLIEYNTESFDLETTEEDIVRWNRLLSFDYKPEFLEQRIMVLKLSGYLCSRGACVIHACAVIRGGYAWLFAAPSGTGKTTLFRNWKAVFGENVRILCGDMPFVGRSTSGDICVYPTPWNGKENYGSLEKAPLGGILLLSQGNMNEMKRLKPAEAAASVYSHWLCTSDSVDTVRNLSRLEETVLDSVPSWNFINRGDRESALYSVRVIDRYLEGKREAGSKSEIL